MLQYLSNDELREFGHHSSHNCINLDFFSYSNLSILFLSKAHFDEYDERK